MQLEGLSGMEVAARLRETDRQALIVFLTQTADYLTAGCTVRAFRYLLKPVRAELLQECFTSAREELSSTADGSIVLGSGLQQILVAPNDIICIRASGNYVHVLTTGGKLKIREQIGVLADRLPPQFVRVHRSDIINVLHVSRLEAETVTLLDGQRLPVSRKNRRRLREQFAAFH